MSTGDVSEVAKIGTSQLYKVYVPP